MKIIFVFIFLFSFNSFAKRNMSAIQSYELYGNHSNAKGNAGANFNILNVSTIDQTVSWSGGMLPNHGTPQNCIIQEGYNTQYVTKIDDNTYRVKPQGFFSIMCNVIGGNIAKGEGVVKVEFEIEQDRGAIVVSGAMYVQDLHDSGWRGWGDTGAGTFSVNGGRAF